MQEKAQTRTTRINFTKAKIQALTSGSKKRVWFYDTAEKGLMVQVTETGAKSFYLYKKVNRVPEKMFIGVFPDTTVEMARKSAIDLKGQVVRGENPQDKKRKERQEETFGAFFQRYLENHSKVFKKSWKYDEREVNKFLKPFFNRKLTEIKNSEIRLLHETILKENGLYQANRILERVRSIYNKALEWGWEGINPAIGIKKYKEKSRDRFILPHEMPHLISAIKLEKNETARDYLWMLLLTGARRTNTVQMRWEEINWHQKLWRIPDSKNGEPLIIPLVDQAIEILVNRKKNGTSEWVFPSDFDPQKHLVNIKRAWRRVLARATVSMWRKEERLSEVFERCCWLDRDGDYLVPFVKEIRSRAEKMNVTLPKGLDDIHIHDIRRTLGSYQAINGSSLQIIGRSLGHKSTQATQVYARLIIDPVRTSVQSAVDSMLSI